MGWYEINFILGSAFTLIAGIFVLRRGESRRITQQIWFLLCLSTSIWHAGRFLVAIAPDEAFAGKAVYIIYFGAIFTPPLFVHFISSLLGEERKQRVILILSYVIALIEIGLLVSGRLTRGVRQDVNLGYYEIPTPLYLVHFIVFVTLPTYALVRLIMVYFQVELAGRKNQLKYVICASLIGFIGGGTSFLPLIQSSFPPIGAPLTYFYTFPIAYAIARYRLMDIDVVIKRSLIYALLLLALLVPCYLLVIWGQISFFGQVNLTFSLVALGLLIVVGFLFPKLRFRTEEALERVLFKKGYDYRETLLRSSRDMVSIVDLQTISNSTVHTVGRAMGIEKASLFLSDEIQGSFGLRASIGLSLHQSEGSMLLRDDPLVQRLTERPEVLVREELEMARDGRQGKVVASRMAQLEAEITLPLVSKEKLIGVLNLGHKEGRKMYSHEDLGVLSTLANQAAIAMENARLYENLKNSQNIIRRADRLSSLGVLTAGLAHEIRNPLVAIRTFTQLLPERYQDREFREEFQAIALREVDRICGLVTDLLSFARTSAPKLSVENINEIAESIVRILETEAKERGVQIDRCFAPSLPKIFIDKEQLKQVLMNVILNAIQSIEGSGVVEVSTCLFAKNGSSQFVQVAVRDSGVGIPEKDLENIFNPFFTTKKDGSGLGLSISHQIVQEHGGYIFVESKVGEGTTFFINLPVYQRGEGLPSSP